MKMLQRNTRLLGVTNYLNNYFAMYARLTRSRIRVVLASSDYLYARLTSSRIRVELYPPATYG